MATQTDRRYVVWIDGRRRETEFKMWAGSGELARIRAAAQLGLKSYEVVAMLDKGGL